MLSDGNKIVFLSGGGNTCCVLPLSRLAYGRTLFGVRSHFVLPAEKCSLGVHAPLVVLSLPSSPAPPCRQAQKMDTARSDVSSALPNMCPSSGLRVVLPDRFPLRNVPPPALTNKTTRSQTTTTFSSARTPKWTAPSPVSGRRFLRCPTLGADRPELG